MYTVVYFSQGNVMQTLNNFFPSISRKFKSLCLITAAVSSITTVFPAQAEPIKVKYEEVVRSILYTPMYVAMNKGFFKDANIDLSIKTSQGADKAMAALLSGSADIVLVGPEASIYVANSESPVKPKLFAGLTATDGFILASRTPVKSMNWNDLKGKKLLAFRPGSTPDVFLEAALRKNNIDPKKDITLINNIGPTARVGAWLSGQGDYAIFLEPEFSILESQGKAFAMVSIGQEVGNVDYTAFTSTDKYIANHKELIQTWTNVVAKALKYTSEAPVEEIANELTSFFPGMKKEELISAINRYRGFHIWKSTPLIQPEAINQMQDMLITSQLLKANNKVPYEKVVDPEFAKKVAQ